MTIPKSLLDLVRQRAQFICEYCHYPELLSSAPLSLDLNDERREEQFIQKARQKWLESGLHPRKGDSKQFESPESSSIGNGD